MVGGINSSDYGMSMGKVIFDKEDNRAKISQKVAGLDVNEYVEGIKEAKMIAAKPLEDKIDVSTKMLASLGQYKTKLDSLRSAASTMSNRISNKETTAISNAFEQKTATTTSNDVSITPSQSANASSFSMTVNQLATNDFRKFKITSPNMNTALGITGVFTIGTNVPGTAQTINVTPTMTLSDLEAAIMNVSGTSKVNVDLVQTSMGATNNTYELKLNAQNTGQPIILHTTSGTPLTDLNLQSLPTYYQAGHFMTTNELTDLHLVGTLTVGSNEPGAVATPINITDGMTLTSIKDAINAQMATTGVRASFDLTYYDPITSTNPRGYQLKLYAVLPGTSTPDTTSTTTVTLSDTGGIMSALGLTNPQTDYDGLIAKVNCDGTDYTNPSNIIDGTASVMCIIPGATVTLNNASGTLFTGSIVEDKISFATAIVNFVDVYNDLVTFYGKQTQTDPDPDKAGKGADGADLYGNKWVQKSFRDIKNTVLSAMAGVPGDLSSLKQLGFTTINDGTLVQLDKTAEALFQSAVDSNFDGITQLFSNIVTSTNQSYSVTNMPANFSSSWGGKPINISLTNSGTATTGTITINGTSYPATLSAGTGVTDVTIDDPNNMSGLRGISIRYTGTIAPDNVPVTTTITMTQGIMASLDSQLYTVLDTTNNSDKDNPGMLGTYYLEAGRLTKTKTESTAKIEKIKKDAEKTGKNMEKQFMRVYEATIQLESIMNMIESFNKVNR